jgi:hypothetical protein
MLSRSPGVTEGQLIVVMETEILRIGTAIHETEQRKRYIVYPGFKSVDRIDQQLLNSMDGSPFKFSRALQSNAVFKFEKMLRPTAITAYLFDQEKKLIAVKRKLIEDVKENAN